MAERTIRDALKLAQRDPAFAVDLVKNPGKHAKQFNLTREQVASLNSGKRLMMEAVRAGTRVPSATAGGGGY